jgi:hypothetical protein
MNNERKQQVAIAAAELVGDFIKHMTSTEVYIIGKPFIGNPGAVSTNT